MKTYILTVDESHDEVIQALSKALKIDIEEITEKVENEVLLLAMEEGKKYGRLSEDDSRDFIQNLGK